MMENNQSQTIKNQGISEFFAYDYFFYQQRKRQLKDRLKSIKLEFEKHQENLKFIHQDLLLKNELTDQYLMGNLESAVKFQQKPPSTLKISQEEQEFLNLVHNPQTQRQTIPDSTNIRLVLHGKMIGYECGICNKKQYPHFFQLAGHIKQALNHKTESKKKKRTKGNIQILNKIPHCQNTKTTVNTSKDDFENQRSDVLSLQCFQDIIEIDNLLTDKIILLTDDFLIKEIQNFNSQNQQFQFY